MDKKVWGKLLYVFGYDINWWKGDGKLLLLMCLQNQKKKKRDTKVSYIVKRKKIKRMQTKEVHNEVSSSQD